MIVEHNGRIFQVSFKKIHRTATRKKKKVQLIDTKCTIITKDKLSDLWSEARGLCLGVSKQYIGDKYNKVIGKKYALLDALTTWSSSDGKSRLLYGTRAFRTAIWKKFNETFGDWK